MNWILSSIHSFIHSFRRPQPNYCSRLAAQPALLSTRDESSLVDTTLPSLIRVSMNVDTRRPHRRCPCVACHRTSWLAGNSGLRRQWQWPARPSRSCLTKLEGGREVYVGDSVSPTGVMNSAEHGGIWSIGGLFHSDSKWPPFAAIEQDRLYRRLKQSYL